MILVGLIRGVTRDDHDDGVAWAPYVGPGGGGLVLDAAF